MALPIGTVLDGKFKIVGILGEGGMGTVYKVEQAGAPGTPPYYYAVKELLISPNTSEEDRRSAIDRFNREIELLRGLKHPRIVALMLPFYQHGNYYYTMEYVPGKSLEKILEDNKGPLPEEKVIKWMIQVCEALSYIHTRNPPIILRDLKPGNIMVTQDDDVLLIDFGIARRFDPNKRTNTENLGTISYASPEHLGSITAPGQKRSAQNPGKLVQTDARSDIYSLGATMYHLLTNYEPDPIQTPAPGSILAKNPRLRTVLLGTNRVCPVEQVIIKAMQQEPAQRFQNADAMRTALVQCLPNQAAPVTVQIPAMSPNATIVVPATSAQGLICPKCGFQNRPGAKFCKRDGQPLVQGMAAPPRVQAPPVRTSIPSRPVQQPLPPRRTSIPSRPVTNPSNPNAIPARNGALSPTPVTPAVDASTAYRLGLQHLTNKNYNEAINQFRLALRLGGTSYEVLYNLGRVYRQYGQTFKEKDRRLFTENLTLAAEQFEAATRLKPDALDAYFQLGMSYRDLGLLQQALVAFKKVQALSPQDPAVYYQLGLVSMEQGFYRTAEAFFLDGLKINPTHTFILIAIGRLYIEMKQLPSAISTLRQATQSDPALWEGWYELGRAHMKQREWRLAINALEQARQRGPFVPDIYSAMANCYLKMNKKLEARQMVNETLQRDPNNAEAIRLQKQL